METTLTSLVSRLHAYKGQWPIVADRSGVPISTLRKIAQGVIKDPSVNTCDRLRTALDEMPPPASDAETPGRTQ